MNDSNVTNPLDARIIEAVRLRLGTELNLRELTPNDVMLAIQDVIYVVFSEAREISLTKEVWKANTRK